MLTSFQNSPYFLCHHGIKGQQWGIRRFQNEDGSLTPEGKTRYQLGKEYSKEQSKIEREHFNKLIKQSKAYQDAIHESERLLNKYGLDADDGGGGYTDRFSKDELRRAGDRYWQCQENISMYEEAMTAKAKKYADNKIIEKYGDTALKDIEHYQNVKSNTILAACGGITLLFILGDYLGRRKR